MWIKTVREASKLERFHSKPLLFRQDVAQHSFNALFIALEIAQGVKGVDENRLMKYILLHDLAETETGDCTGSAKKEHPELKKVLDKIEKRWYDRNLPQYLRESIGPSPLEKDIAKFADMIEGYYTALIDIRLGNLTLVEAARDLSGNIQEMHMEDDIDRSTFKNVMYIMRDVEEEFEDVITRYNI